MDLRTYRSVALEKRLPAHVRSARRRLGHIDLAGLDTSDLWKLHDDPPRGMSGPSLLDLKTELADRMMRHCTLCERRCGVDRSVGEVGFCGVGNGSSYFFEQILWGEERPVVPSHEVFFSGCNMRCDFCYSHESLLDPCRGKRVLPAEFADLIERRRQEGAVNLNLIGGEPTVHLPNILRTLQMLKQSQAVVWNSNFLMSGEAMKLLDGVVDLYLGDFRFGCETCAQKIGGTEGYVETAKRNFLAAARQGDLIIRHLLLPGHIDCCLRPVAKWVLKELPDVPFNLMFQYMPFYKALDEPGLCRSLYLEEEEEAERVVSSLGLNTKRWNRLLRRQTAVDGVGKGKMTTTVSIRPDGRVAIMHLHGEMVELIRGLGVEGL